MVKEQWIYHGKISMHKPRILNGRRYRTRTSDYLLIEAIQKGISCYRMTEDSQVTYDHKMGAGYVTHVYVPLINPRTNTYKIFYDETNKYHLPTVIYNYDFSSERRLFNHDRGSRIFFDNSQALNSKLGLIKPALFNAVSKEWQYMSLVSPLRSQLAFSQMLQKFSPNLYEVYPKSVPMLHGKEQSEAMIELIHSSDRFYIKRALSAHDPHHHQTQISVHKKRGRSCF